MGYEKLKKVAESLRLDFLDEWFQKRKGRVGAKGFQASSMMLALFVMHILGIPSERQLARRLEDPELRRVCGLKRKPNHSTFSKFRKRLGILGMEEIFKWLVERAKKAELIKGRIIAFDSTGFRAYSNPRKKHCTDSCAAWGYDAAKKQHFFGYKLHMAVDAEVELPVALTVLPANRHDSKGFRPTFEKLKRVLTFQVQKVLGDCAYKSLWISKWIREELGAVPVIPHRRAEKPKDPVYKKRTAIERVNSRAKKLLGLDNLRMRGLWSATFHALMVACSMLFAALGSFIAGFGDWRAVVHLTT